MCEQSAACHKSSLIQFGDFFRINHCNATLLSCLIETPRYRFDICGISLVYFCSIEPRYRIDVSHLFYLFSLLLGHALIFLSQQSEIFSCEEMLPRSSRLLNLFAAHLIDCLSITVFGYRL